MSGIKYCPICFFDRESNFYHDSSLMFDGVMAGVVDYCYSRFHELTLFVELLENGYSTPGCVINNLAITQHEWLMKNYRLTQFIICAGRNFLTSGFTEDPDVRIINTRYKEFESAGGFKNTGNINTLADLLWFATRVNGDFLSESLIHRVANNITMKDCITYRAVMNMIEWEIQSSPSFKYRYEAIYFRAVDICDAVLKRTDYRDSIITENHYAIMLDLLKEDRDFARVYPYIYRDLNYKAGKYRDETRRKVYQLGFLCPGCQLDKYAKQLDKLTVEDKVNVLGELF